ncbi:MAG: phosphonate metabolism protein/1,5-bisphosphokinase (PRPP-forming) PhnN [Candidatus Thorarchaeota archaeon]
MTKNFSGMLFLVVGNSGSGKDSIISGVVEKYSPSLTQIYVPKRYITRQASDTEKNISITPEIFKKMQEEGQFALRWHIYNLDYGIPIEIDYWLNKGTSVIINVSRKIVKEAKEIYANIKVVFIYVPLEITIERLKKRAREDSELLKERIERAKNNQLFPEADFIIDNSGKLDAAINQFLDYLVSCTIKNLKR